MQMVKSTSSTQLNPTDTDLAALQGSWKQVRIEADGISDPSDGFTVAGALTIISAKRFKVQTVDGVVLLEGTFMLDATTKPKSITWIDSIGPDAGKQLPASYTLDGDSFVFIAADEGAPRPTVFHTTQGLVMRSFVRCRQGG